jgi:hypothetical protein
VQTNVFSVKIVAFHIAQKKKTFCTFQKLFSEIAILLKIKITETVIKPFFIFYNYQAFLGFLKLF